jgi:hypothetical protein
MWAMEGEFLGKEGHVPNINNKNLKYVEKWGRGNCKSGSTQFRFMFISKFSGCALCEKFLP